MFRAIAFAVLAASAFAPAIGAEPEVIDDDIIKGFKETSLAVRGHPEASDEAKLAVITGACTTLISSSDMADYAMRLASIRDGYVRGYVIRLFKDSKAGGLNIASMNLNRNICTQLLAYSRDRANTQASLVLEPVPGATVRPSQ